MALAARPEQVPPRLRTELDRAHRSGTLTRIALKALTRAEAEEFLAPTIGPAMASSLYDESGGNPFYLEQLARSLDRATRAPRATRRIAPQLGVQHPWPRRWPTACSAQRQRPPRAAGSRGRGRQLRAGAAAAAAGVVEAVALSAVDELVALGVIRRADVPHRFRFRHPLVRRAVYVSTPAGWLLAAHERSASALASRGATATQRAHHVERSSRQGDAQAVAVLRQAGEEAAHRAPESAARWYAGALRLLRDDAPAANRVGSSRASKRPRDVRPLQRELCGPARELRAGSCGCDRAPGSAHHRLRRDRASPGSPRRGPPAAHRGAGGAR